MHFFQHLLALTGIAIFPLPGYLLTRGWLRHEGSPLSEDSRIARIALGYALGIAILYATSQVGFPFFLGVYGALFAAIAFFRWRTPHQNARGRLSPELRILVAILLGYLAFRLIPAISRELPTGWDPYFSLLFTDRITETARAIHDWRPYENIELNYPIGPHLLLGLIAWLAKLEPHIPFKMAIPWFISLTGLQVYGLVSRAARDRTLALYAAVAYLLTADWGSFGYALWGGLPNLMGMYVFLGAVAVLVQVTAIGVGRAEPAAHPREVLALGLLLLAVCLIHHHCMVAAGGVMAWILLRAWLASAERTDTFNGDARRLTLDLVLKAGTLAVALGAPYFRDFLLKIPRISQSGLNVLHEGAMSPRELDESLGPWFFFATVMGWLWFRRKRAEFRVAPALLWATSGMMLLFFVGDYGIRIVTILLYYKQVAPFTPTRFLTDAVMLLAFYAGVFWLQLGQQLQLSRRATLLLIAVGLAWLLPTYKDTFREPVPDPTLAAYAWIRTNARPDAWVWDGSDFHTSYLTRRASGNVPFPTSEFRFAAGIHEAIAEVRAGRVPELARGKQFIQVLRDGEPVPAGMREIWSETSGKVRLAEKIIP